MEQQRFEQVLGAGRGVKLCQLVFVFKRPLSGQERCAAAGALRERLELPGLTVSWGEDEQGFEAALPGTVTLAALSRIQDTVAGACGVHCFALRREDGR